MANYIGAHCPVCNKRFVDADDVVVCPICGAPHHRSCYDEQGRCALNELHIQGHTWQRPEEAKQTNDKHSDEAVCSSCGAYNPQSGLFCQVCGGSLRKQSSSAPQGFQPFTAKAFGQTVDSGSSGAYKAAFGGLSPDEMVNDISARDLALYIGPNSHYFLPRFKQILQNKSFSPNFAAFVFNFLYFFYRKMHLAGSILLLLLAITQIPALFIAQEYTSFIIANFEDISIGIMPVFEPQNHLWAYSVLPYMRTVLLLIGILFSSFANRIYMGVVMKNVRKIKSSFIDEEGKVDDKCYTESLVKHGRTSRNAVIISFVGIFAVYLIVCVVVAVSVL